MYTRNFPDLLPKTSYLIFGPRGTGKSTYLRAQFPKALYIDLLEAKHYNELLANPSKLAIKIPPNFKEVIIIDEIQKIPQLMDEIHRLISLKKHSFILTGSSARKLKRSGANLLAGRARSYNFFPLSINEIGKDFDLDKVLISGLLPEAFTTNDSEHFLNTYIQTYLKEEIDQEGLTRNLSGFARFLEAASFSQGQILNISNVSNECHVDRKVCENYFKILEDLLIAYRIPVFNKRAKRKLAVQKKFFFFDCGVYQSIRPKGPLDRPEEIGGAAWETLLLQEFKSLNQYLNLGYEVFTWRTKDKVEVDFILYGTRGLIALEIKRSKRYSKEDLKGLKLFKHDYPQAKTFFLYGGNENRFEEEIQVISFINFLINFKKYL